MKISEIISISICSTMLFGCASPHPTSGPKGPHLVTSSYSTPSGAHYAEVGVEFTTVGDFFALVSPSRWKSPVATGGSLSWMNPNAWSEDAGRTGRILLGEVVIVGGTVAVVAAVSGSDDDGGGGGGPTEPGTPPPDPEDPPK